jgi:glycosyltransferase involved in cell wall biosynthesis
VVTKRLTFAVPGDLATPTGGYAYDRRIVEELRGRGWQVDVVNIGDGFPKPSAALLAKAHDMLACTPVGVPIVIDGLAFGVMNKEASLLAQTHTLVALVHHPLALETGLSPQDAESLRASERAALAQARHTITTSALTVDILIADYGVPRQTITVALPGNDPMPPAMPSTDGTCRLLTVGSIVPRKGYDVLIAALAQIADLPWQLTIVGDPTRSPETATALIRAVQHTGIAGKISFAGVLNDDALVAEYAHSDVFVTASHFEGYGMAVAAAIASGLPVVATAGGALSQTIGDAGLLVAANDAGALAAGLRSFMTDVHVRRRLRHASLTAAKMLPIWSDTAACFAAAIEGLA